VKSCMQVEGGQAVRSNRRAPHHQQRVLIQSAQICARDASVPSRSR
jgi:hypothetical protein